MLPLHDLLARFKNLTNTDKVKKELLSEEISHIVGFPVKHTQISFSKNTIFFKVNPLVKTELALKKEEVLQNIKKIKGLGHITDIK